MSEQADPRSEKAIATLHPKVQPLARQLILNAAAQGITMKITSGTRTYDEQDRLFRQASDGIDNDGDGRTDEADERVTKAPAGFSNHNFGFAFDVTQFNGPAPIWDGPAYRKVGAIGKALGFEWGGDWTSIVDEPHFQLRPDWARGLSEREMLADLRLRRREGKDAFTGEPTTVISGTPARPGVTILPEPTRPPGFVATKSPVANRGIAPDSFLTELVAIGRTLPPEVYTRRDDPKPPHEDIYTKVKAKLGPWRGDRHRLAVLLEVLRVLGGWESSWDWDAGKDEHNPGEDSPAEMSAGLWQISCDSLGFGADIKKLAAEHGIDGPIKFQTVMKSDHAFAVEYTARLLRYTDEHNGPVRRGLILPDLKVKSVAEFEQLLA